MQPILGKRSLVKRIQWNLEKSSITLNTLSQCTREKCTYHSHVFFFYS